MKPEYRPFVDELIELCIKEDIGDGDHTSLSCIPAGEHGRMRLLCKQEGIIAGIEIARIVFDRLDPDMHFEQVLHDGDRVKPGDVAFYVSGRLRSLEDIDEVFTAGGADRIMFDNFTPAMTREAVKKVAGRCETESSGVITLDTIRDYAECGVDFISVGALTHQIKSLDMSLKACE